MRNKGTFIDERQPIDIFSTASTIIDEAVEHTLGKDGLNTAIPTQNSYLSIINDGKTIMESLSSNDKAIQLALNTLKESAFATNLNAGDGTTTTAVLQHQLLKKCYGLPSSLLIKARNKLLEELSNLRKDIESKEDLNKVVNVALGGDEELSKIVMEAFGDDLEQPIRPALIKGHDMLSKTTQIDGVSLTPVEINPVVLSNMPPALDEEFNVLIINQNLSRLDSGFIEILNRITKSKRKTILLYTEIMPSVLDQLLFNIQEGSLHLIPIRLAYPIDKVKDYISALEYYFDAPVFDDLHPYQTFDKESELEFGKCTGYVINKDSAVIKGAKQDKTFEILPPKSSIIEVGFVTYSKQEEDYRRLEDAIHSAYNALTSGYTIGSGYTLLTLSHSLDTNDEPNYTLIKEALSYLFNKLSIQSEKQLDEYIEYCMNNVFDSYKVTEQVILNSFTVVSQVLSTRCILVPYE